jgi:hypothetical protein
MLFKKFSINKIKHTQADYKEKESEVFIKSKAVTVGLDRIQAFIVHVTNGKHFEKICATVFTS